MCVLNSMGKILNRNLKLSYRTTWIHEDKIAYLATVCLDISPFMPLSTNLNMLHTQRIIYIYLSDKVLKFVKK